MLLVTRQPCNGTTPRLDVHSSPPLRRSRRGHCTAHSAAQPCCDNPHTSTVTTRRKCKTTNTQSHTMHYQRILIESSPDNSTNLTHIMQVKIDDTIPTQGNRIPTEWTVAIIACVRTEAPTPIRHPFSYATKTCRQEQLHCSEKPIQQKRRSNIDC